jgi:two-component system phosphate regulon response regulator OmpR
MWFDVECFSDMPENSMRILVVDDDAGLRALLSDYLVREGFSVAGAEDGHAMDDWLAGHEVDLIILDLMLTGEDGLALARRLRTQTDMPIIMLSARGDDVDRIVGLEVGADDYLPKPFNPRELLARIRAVMRRRAPSAREDETPRDAVIRFGPYRLDPVQHELLRGDDPVGLTSGEFDLLLVLAEHPDRVLSRDLLLDLLKGYDRAPFDRSIDVLIARLRAKIEPETKHPRYIRTIWGKGYLFTPMGDA